MINNSNKMRKKITEIITVAIYMFFLQSCCVCASDYSSLMDLLGETRDVMLNTGKQLPEHPTDAPTKAAVKQQVEHVTAKITKVEAAGKAGRRKLRRGIRELDGYVQTLATSLTKGDESNDD